MKTAEELSREVRRTLRSIEERDDELREELADKRASREMQDEAEALDAGPEFPSRALEGGQASFAMETIVLRTGRPVLAVSNNEPELDFQDAESEVWRDRLTRVRGALVEAITAVGRIELRHHPQFDWVGTGWLVADDIVVTNRHVAQEFARQDGAQFVFRQNYDRRTMEASVDFLEEYGRTESRAFDLVEVLHIEGHTGPDIAFLRVEPRDDMDLAPAIRLSEERDIDDRRVAVIGYPARDSRIPDQRLMQQIFGNVYDKKRLAPGELINVDDDALLHDCSTLGGNSGSVVLDLEAGEALGVHFAGRFLRANYAVPSWIVAERVHQLRSSSQHAVYMPSKGSRTVKSSSGTETTMSPAHPSSPNTFNLTVPLQVTIEVGGPVQVEDEAIGVSPLPAGTQPKRVFNGGDGRSSDTISGAEARPPTP